LLCTKYETHNRGSYTEFIKSLDKGQVSVSTFRPGIARVNHWHHTKNEKFVVTNAKGVIHFGNIDSNGLEYFFSGEKMEAIDVSPDYTHSIENIGDTDLVTIMWANELFDPEKSDARTEKV